MSIWYRAMAYRLNGLLNRLQAREVKLLALVIVLVIAAGQYGLGYTMGWYRMMSVEDQVARRQSEVQQLESQLAELRRQQENPQQQQLQNRIDRLENDISQIDEQLARLTDELVAPDEMVRVIQQLLNAQTGLTLTRFTTLPVTTTQSTTGNNDSALFRHSVRLELEGSFNALARYVRLIEAANWQIYWQSLDYEIQDYPTGRAVMTLYTLSTEEVWLDV